MMLRPVKQMQANIVYCGTSILFGTIGLFGFVFINKITSLRLVLMENIVEPDETFDFCCLSLAHPSGIQGGAYFTKLLNNGKPLYIQTGQSKLKQGFVKTGKKHHCDLMFDNNAASLIHWLEKLEEKCQQLILEKSGDWFQGSLDASDLESAFGSCIRVFKSGKFYLLRVSVKGDLADLKVYGERQELLTAEAVTSDSEIVSILEVQGIKFTTRTFQIEIELKQMMMIDKNPLFDSCLIKRNKEKQEPLEPHSQECKQADVVLQPSDTSEEMPTEKDVIIDDLIIELEPESDEIKEISELEINNESDTLVLKRPNQVYLELYKEARAKAKEAKKNAIVSYLEAKNIKKTYMLDIGDEDSDFDAEIDEVSESELEFF